VRMLGLCSVLLASIALFAANASIADRNGLLGLVIKTPEPAMQTLLPKKTPVPTRVVAAKSPTVHHTVAHRKPVPKRNWFSRLFHRN